MKSIILSGLIAILFSYSAVAQTILTPKTQLVGKAFGDSVYNVNPSTNRSLTREYAGDINGDGISDFYLTLDLADERTSDASDRIDKTFIWFGGSTTKLLPDSVLYGFNGYYIGDLNDDNKSDYIRLFDGNVSRLYVGGDSLTLPDAEITTTLRILAHGDFDGDGFNDVLIYRLANGNDFVYFIWGAADIPSIETNLVDLNSLDFLTRLSAVTWRNVGITDINNDGLPELYDIFYTGTQNLSVFQIDGLRNLELVQTLEILAPGSNSRNFILHTEDIDGTGNEELIFPNETNGLSYIKTLPDSVGVDAASIVELSATIAYPIGDFDGNGKTDYLQEEDGSTPIRLYELGETNLINELILDVDPNENQFFGGIINEYYPYTTLDQDADGLDDVFIAWQNGNLLGNRIYFGNAGRTATDTTSFTFQNLITNASSSDYTINLGDLNGDGIEDFGLNRSNFAGQFEIYFGGKSSYTSPDQVIEGLEGTRRETHTMAAGLDLNGDMNDDFCVSISANDADNVFDYEIDCYYGPINVGNGPDHTIVPNAALPKSLITMYSVGDINNDGTDDLVYSLFSERANTYVVLGGTSPSTEADFSIPYYSTSAINSGDVTGDGVPDLVLANTQDRPTYFDSTGTNSFGSSGGIRVYSTYDEGAGESFNDSTYLRLQSPFFNNLANVSFWGMSVQNGDFTGDGIADIVTIPAFNSDLENPLSPIQNGIEAVYLFEGGAALDSIPDLSFPIKLTDLGVGLPTPSPYTNMPRVFSDLITLPDLTGDGSNELLIAGFPVELPGATDTVRYSNRAILYPGGPIDILTMNEPVILESPNPAVTLGSKGNFINLQHTSAVGEFDNANGLDVLLLTNDFNNATATINWFEIGDGVVTSLRGGDDSNGELPGAFRLDQNYPNPFNPTTNISFELARNSEVNLSVFNILGQKVATLVSSRLAAGQHSVQFNALNLASGVYIYRIEAGSFIETKKMILVK